MQKSKKEKIENSSFVIDDNRGEFSWRYKPPSAFNIKALA